MADLFPKNGSGHRPEIVEAYSYTDENGTLLYQRVRKIPKAFKYRRPDGMGGWIEDRNGIPAVLYYLPQLVAAPKDTIVFLVEGEKDVHTLERMGFPATTAGGAKDWRPGFAPFFTGRRVVLLPDNDEPGRGYSNTAAADIAKVATSTKIVQLPGLKISGDITDWVAAQDPLGCREVLAELIDQAPEWKAAGLEIPVSTNPLIMEHGTVADLRATHFEEEPAIVQGFLYRRGVSQATGEGGIGKGFLGIQLVAALATNGSSQWIGLQIPGTHRAGFFGMEGFAPRHHHRIDAAVSLYGSDWMRRAEIRVPGFGGASFWDITRDELRNQLIEWVLTQKLEILVIDPFSHAKDPRLKEGDGGDMTIVTQALAAIRDATDCAIVLVHHPPYDRQGGRGSSALRNVLDAEIFLEGQGPKEQYLLPGGLVRAIWTKPDRDGVCPKPIMLERQLNGLLLPTDRRLERTDRSKKKRDRLEAEREILQVRHRINAQGMVEALRDHEIIASIRTVQRDLEKLQEEKQVVAIGHGPDTEYQFVLSRSTTVGNVP